VVGSSNFSRMSQPRVGASTRFKWNTRSSDRVTQTWMQEMPTIVDVIHTPEYEPTTTDVEEEKNPAQEAEHPEEDT
jgi:hypothetical protein